MVSTWRLLTKIQLQGILISRPRDGPLFRLIVLIRPISGSLLNLVSFRGPVFYLRLPALLYGIGVSACRLFAMIFPFPVDKWKKSPLHRGLSGGISNLQIEVSFPRPQPPMPICNGNQIPILYRVAIRRRRRRHPAGAEKIAEC